MKCASKEMKTVFKSIDKSCDLCSAAANTEKIQKMAARKERVLMKQYESGRLNRYVAETAIEPDRALMYDQPSYMRDESKLLKFRMTNLKQQHYFIEPARARALAKEIEEAEEESPGITQQLMQDQEMAAVMSRVFEGMRALTISGMPQVPESGLTADPVGPPDGIQSRSLEASPGSEPARTSAGPLWVDIEQGENAGPQVESRKKSGRSCVLM